MTADVMGAARTALEEARTALRADRDDIDRQLAVLDESLTWFDTLTGVAWPEPQPEPEPAVADQAASARRILEERKKLTATTGDSAKKAAALDRANRRVPCPDCGRDCSLAGLGAHRASHKRAAKADSTPTSSPAPIPPAPVGPAPAFGVGDALTALG